MIDHISPSMLNLFCNCQEAFRRRYIEGEKIPPAIAMLVGTGVHKAAEINHKQKINSGLDMPLNDILDAAADGFQEAVEDNGVYYTGSRQELQKELGKAQDQSINLAAVYSKKVAPEISPIAAEFKLQARHPDLELPFLGIVDVLDDNNTAMDLKTARTKWRHGKERESLQPDIYRYLLWQEYGHDHKFAFHVMAYDGYTQYIECEQKSDIGYIVNIAGALLNACKSGVFMPAVPGHWICQPAYCGYYTSCRARRK